MINLETGVEQFTSDLEAFADTHRIPSDWFANIDHIAFKAADAVDLTRYVEKLRPQADRISCIEMDGRRLVAVRLSGSMAVGRFGSVQLVELIEPRPQRLGLDSDGFDHAEFYYPGFEEVAGILDIRGVPWELQYNPKHAWVNVQVNATGQQLKLNDSPLGPIIEAELHAGEAHLL